MRTFFCSFRSHPLELSEHSCFYGNNLKIKAVKSESCARVIPIMPSAWGSQGKREERVRLSGTWMKKKKKKERRRVCV